MIPSKLKMGLRNMVYVPPALMISASTAFASTGGGGNLPWDGPITIIEQDLSGTIAHAFIIMAIVVTGLMWAFGEHGSSMKKVMGIAAGGAIALGATSLISGLNLGSGAVIGGGSDILPAVFASITIGYAASVGYLTVRGKRKQAAE